MMRLGSDMGCSLSPSSAEGTRASLEQAPVIHPRLALPSDAQDEVVARHVRKAAEVDGVGKFLAARGETLVASGGDAESVACHDGPRGALPEVDPRAAMRLDLGGEPYVRPFCPDEASSREPAVGEGRESVRRETERAIGAGDHPDGVEGGAVQIDAAARVAEVRPASSAVEAAALFVEGVHEAAH